MPESTWWTILIILIIVVALIAVQSPQDEPWPHPSDENNPYRNWEE